MLSTGLSFGLPRMSSVPLCPVSTVREVLDGLESRPLWVWAHVRLLGYSVLGLDSVSGFLF